MTTLEEVFLRVEQKEEEQEGKREVERKLSLKQETVSEDNEESKNNLESNHNEINSEKHDESEALQDYSISKEQVEGTLLNFFIHLYALGLKRIHIYKRNIASILNDLFFPMILILLGLGVAKIAFFYTSDPRVWSIEDFPEKQRIMYNSNNVQGGATSASVIAKLDNPSWYDPKSVTVTGAADSVNSLKSLDGLIGDESKKGPVEPYRFGSFYFNRIDSGADAFEMVTIANLTSQDALPEFAQFGFNALMRVATGNAGWKMEVKMAPFPIS